MEDDQILNENKIWVCCDAFKGTMTSMEVNAILCDVLGNAGLECRSTPMADGGEGSLAIIESLGLAERVEVTTCDPLHRSLPSYYLRQGQKAMLDMSAASGLHLLEAGERQPLRLSSYGTGMLIKHALNHGVKAIDFFLGGSATVDGGTGLLYALAGAAMPEGNPLLDKSLTENIYGVKALLGKISIRLLTDVENPVLGTQGAVQVFGPQKGAGPGDLVILERQMAYWLRTMEEQAGRKLDAVAGLGAAGAVGLPLYALGQATVESGLGYFSALLSYDAMMDWCDVLVTGEGCIDDQTLMGKGPGRLAMDAKKKGKRVAGVAGQVKSRSEVFDYLIPASTEPLSETEMKASARERLIRAAMVLSKALNPDFLSD